MNASEIPASIDILHSLQLLRSSDPADRKRGILTLSAIQDDPRVAQVFERFYESDPDASVRSTAWHALNLAGPSIPTPIPAAKSPAPAVPKKNNAASVSLTALEAATESAPLALVHKKQKTLRLFLVNPANASFIHKEKTRLTTQKKETRMLPWIMGGVLLAVGVLWGVTLPDWYDWYQLRQDGGAAQVQTVQASLTILAGGLTVLLVILGGRFMQQRSNQRQPDKCLLRGQLLACSGALDDDGDFKIRLRYRFRTPAGKMVAGQIRQIRNDLKQTDLPQTGTPLAVYYKNEKAYRLL